MRIILSILTLLALIIPSIASAQFYSGSDWHRAPTIIPSGPPDIIFPVQGGAVFTDDFGDGRSGGRTHEGNDLMAPKMTQIMTAQSGTVVSASMTEPSYGYMISIAGDDGYIYNYLHINNDTPGTDDGNGGAKNAYAPNIQRGASVIKGQHIAWVGDSGNAEGAGSHLHFEIRLPDDTAINPYIYLQASLKINSYDINAVKNASPTISIDKGLSSNQTITTYCIPESLIRIKSISSVYYCGIDGKRYVFPSANVYNTWYKDFAAVKIIAPEEMAKIMLGGNVTHRPGVKLVKIQTDSRVYAIDKNGTFRLMVNPTIAEKYYGSSWIKNVEDISDSFFTNYRIGESINN